MREPISLWFSLQFLLLPLFSFLFRWFCCCCCLWQTCIGIWIALEFPFPARYLLFTVHSVCIAAQLLVGQCCKETVGNPVKIQTVAVLVSERLLWQVRHAIAARDAQDMWEQTEATNIVTDHWLQWLLLLLTELLLQLLSQLHDGVIHNVHKA